MGSSLESSQGSIPLTNARGRCKPENTHSLSLKPQLVSLRRGKAQFHTSQWGVGAFEWVKLTPPVCSGHKALSQHPVWVRSCPASPPPGWPHVNPRGAVLSRSYILVNHGFEGYWGDLGIQQRIPWSFSFRAELASEN